MTLLSSLPPTPFSFFFLSTSVERFRTRARMRSYNSHLSIKPVCVLKFLKYFCFVFCYQICSGTTKKINFHMKPSGALADVFFLLFSFSVMYQLPIIFKSNLFCCQLNLNFFFKVFKKNSMPKLYLQFLHLHFLIRVSSLMSSWQALQ